MKSRLSSSDVQHTYFLARALEHKVEGACPRGDEARDDSNSGDQSDSLLIALENDRLAPIASHGKNDLVAITNPKVVGGHRGAGDLDGKCLRCRPNSVMLARHGETKACRAYEEDHDQHEADEAATGRQRAGVEKWRQPFQRAHSLLVALLDELRDDERTNPQEHDHCRA